MALSIASGSLGIAAAQMIAQARPGKDPFPQKIGYPLRNQSQADLAQALAALPD